ncbi:hypothetical protein BKH41_04310 [Helicobacter sp. 12S02232-10]|uniref:hypothetical protein n=1 Tax=Helicobacter sp. 12S02232-10 TaxID=1476197 RepID=UPI000BA54359|nr:hypothetical protein [Helicobacter sp. 12S02232-10]PAF48858.1 hypothetical protein BKH41_04310 [Helicobacter sp. 12S02232-10]
MKLLHPSLIEQYKQDIQSQAQKLYRNDFISIDKEIYGKKSQKSLIFLIPYKNFTKLYFISSDLNDLEKELKNLDSNQLCLEIIQRGDLDLELKDILKKHFTFHTRYEKLLINIKNLKSKIKRDFHTIQYAKNNDLDFIYTTLHTNFDERFDHLPSEQDLLNLIQNHQILIKKTGTEITAYCIYTLNGKTSHFNYLLNLKAEPFTLIALMEEYYEQIKTKNIQYVYLWVDVLKNIRVKNMHLKYGYQSSNIFNHTFIKTNFKE